MKARTKFLIGGLLVLGPVGYLMASSIRETGEYYLTPTELEAKLTADTTFRDVGVKVGARVVPGTIQRDPGGREYAFRVTDGARTFPVVYHGIAPDTFTDGVDVGRSALPRSWRSARLVMRTRPRSIARHLGTNRRQPEDSGLDSRR
jgi:cytochrome c-type biogenesis protein CcmE